MPRKLPEWTVQLLRVLSALGYYTKLVEDAGSSNGDIEDVGADEGWFHSDRIWLRLLEADKQQKTAETDEWRPARQYQYSQERQAQDPCNIRVFFPKKEVCLGESYTVKVLIKNVTADELPSSTLTWQGDSYHLKSAQLAPPVPGFDERPVLLFVSVKPGTRSAQALGETFCLQYGSVGEFHFETNMSFFIGGIMSKIPAMADSYNILMFGPFGSGKSSFANKAFAFLSDAENPTAGIAAVASGEGHVTMELRRYQMPKAKITIADPWGFDYQNYRDNTLKYIIEGRLPDGWGMGDLEDFDRIESLREGEHSIEQRRIHAVLIVVSLGMLQDQYDAYVKVKDPEGASDAEPTVGEQNLAEQLVQFRAQAQQFTRVANLTPMVVVNSIDEELGEEWNMEHERIPEIISMVCSALCVQRADVYLNENYVNITERSPFLDRQMLTILDAAVNRAAMFDNSLASRGRSGYQW